MSDLHWHTVYGITLRSDIALQLPRCAPIASPAMDLRLGSRDRFDALLACSQLIQREDWYHYAHSPDSSIYVRWKGVGEFIVSALGDHVWCAPAPEASEDSFQVYLLGQALSFALLRLGHEPLHGTSVAQGDGAIALLGDSGYGKSSLAASLLAGGCGLLTDDLLLTQPSPHGPLVQPGPPRIKLFAAPAERFLGSAAHGVPMNTLTDKLVIPIRSGQFNPSPVALRAIYVLAPPEEMASQQQLSIERLVGHDAFLALTQNTFNRILVDNGRLKRQLVVMAGLIAAVPVKRIAYPRDLQRLPEIGAALLRDAGLEATGAA